MDMHKRAKCNKKKTINNLPIGIINRLDFIIEFQEVVSMDSILESYEPIVLGSCSTSAIVPKNPLDVDAFQKATNLHGNKPYLQLPELPQRIPPVSKKRKIFTQPTYPSLLPLLITAKFFRTDARNYHVVTKRNSLRRLVSMDENFVVSVVRIGSTLFLRCFSRHHTTNKNDVGFRFEAMCTTNSTSNVNFNQLIDGRIGNYRILMMGETDAIDKQTGASIELKCSRSNASNSDKHKWWLQAFLSKY